MGRSSSEFLSVCRAFSFPFRDKCLNGFEDQLVGRGFARSLGDTSYNHLFDQAFDQVATRSEIAGEVTLSSSQSERHQRNTSMPARSKKQQMAAGAALAAKRGKRSKSSLRGASKQMEQSMSERQLKEFAKTKRKKLPSKKK